MILVNVICYGLSEYESLECEVKRENMLQNGLLNSNNTGWWIIKDMLLSDNENNIIEFTTLIYGGGILCVVLLFINQCILILYAMLCTSQVSIF